MPTKLRILIVEDDAGICELLRDQLEATGYETRVARDGSEAIGRVFQFRPHGMILDLNMPGLDGFGVLQVLNDQAIRLPVLVLTARHDASDVRRAIKLGARDYLTKPFTATQVKARIARLMRASVPASPIIGNVLI